MAMRFQTMNDNADATESGVYLAMSGMHWLALFMLALVLTGCGGAVLPSEGPATQDILFDSRAEEADYTIVPVDDAVAATLASHDPNGLRRVFGGGSSGAFQNRIGVGDVLQIHIWEAAEGGLFSTQERKRAELPPVRVDRNGRITIPFVGAIRAKGLTTQQLQKRIARALDGKAISPQVLVTVVQDVANSVVVNGDVRKPGRYQISLKGSRLLDIIAEAGGASAPARETVVALIRNGKRGIQNLKRIIQDPRENIYVRPGDQIYVSHKPQTFTAFGAVAKTGEYSFDSDRVNLLEAVARAGGLLDNRADARGVFLFRFEDNRILRQMGVSKDQLHPAGRSPVIYVLDMSKPRAFFLAQGMMMRDNDVIYVANSVSTELQKFLSLLNAGTAAIRGTHNTITVITE